jgi:phage tail-like protein
MAGIQYSLGKNHLKHAQLYRMAMEADGALGSVGGDEEHWALLPMLDSGMEDCAWGRFQMDADCSGDAIYYLYVMASNERDVDIQLCDPKLPPEEKRKLFRQGGGLRIGRSDILLYGLTGRYLWLMLEVIGEGAVFRNLKVQAPGDNFMATFPEVYREKNSFFHRYLSVFSSMYNDFQEKLDHRERLLDIANASEERLLLYAHWLGLELTGGYLETEVLRTLVREAGELNRRKGTKACIERICQIMIGETPKIVERSLLQRYVYTDNQAQIDRLYGDSPYDVTLMIRTPVDEKKKKQLFLLLNQFKPVRSRLRMVYLQESGVLDEHTYLDQNALTFAQSDGVLDEGQLSDGTIILQ